MVRCTGHHPPLHRVNKLGLETARLGRIGKVDEEGMVTVVDEFLIGEIHISERILKLVNQWLIDTLKEHLRLSPSYCCFMLTTSDQCQVMAFVFCLPLTQKMASS